MELSVYKKYKETESFLESLYNLTDVNFFDGTANPNYNFKRMKHLLHIAGNPDQSFKIIHVAGTSGKGSVVSLIYNILQCAGYRTGAHFSPFVSVATEKIQINNKFIPVKEFISLIEKIKPILEKCYLSYGSPSHFEAWLLAALVYFKEKKCDFVVLETGCGGRYDGTNAVKKTLLSVITDIGKDHTHILGKTFKKIAFEKAGIIRKMGVVFTATRRPSALAVIEKVCEEQSADLTTVTKQEQPNIALATQVATYLKIPEQSIIKGISKSKLPARFEIVQKKPLIILDGAHNPDKINYLTQKIKKIRNQYKKLHLICGLTNFKNIKQCFASILPLTDYLYCTRFLTPARKTTLPVQLAKELRQLQIIPANIYLDPQQALQAAKQKARATDIILITGSFFLCGDLRKNWFTEENQLEQQTNFYKK